MKETNDAEDVSKVDANDSDMLVNSEDKTTADETAPDAGITEQNVSETKENAPSEEESEGESE